MKWHLTTRFAMCLLVFSAQFVLAQTYLGQTRIASNFNAMDIAVNPLTGKIYGTGAGELTVIDGRTMSTVSITNILLNGNPQYAVTVAVNPITNRVYLTAYGIDDDSANLVVIDGSTNQIIDTITDSIFAVGLGFEQDWIAVDPVTNRVYVAITNGIAVIDGATDQIVDTVTLGSRPLSLAVNYHTNKVYAVGENGQVFEIDGSSHRVSQPISIGQPAGQIAVDVVNNRVFISTADPTTLTAGIASTSGASIYIVDGRNNRRIKIIPCFNGPIAVDPLAHRLWAVNYLYAPPAGRAPQIAETVSLIGIPRNVVLSTLTLSRLAYDPLFKIAVDPVTNEAFALSFYGEVEVFSGRSGPARPIAVHPGHWRNLSPQ
jgi:DNA-binding beta-propeller fold protein YncE